MDTANRARASSAPRPPGGGTRRARPRPRPRGNGAPRPPGAPVQGTVPMPRRILIIDGAPAVHAVVRPSLEAAGYAVESAFDGARGLRLSAAGAPALIVL